jgi:hypothetical protein
MVTVRITLQLKRQVWHLVAWDADGADSQTGLLPTRLKRKFLTQDAAIRYVEGVVGSRLKHETDEAGRTQYISCSVTVIP